MDLKDTRSDPTKELEGVRVEIDDTTWVRIAAAGNDNYKAELVKVAAKYRNGFRARKFTPEMEHKLLTDIEGRTILVGWGGMQENGEELPYTAENAARILREYPRFREQVLQHSGDFEPFRFVEEQIERDTEGN